MMVRRVKGGIAIFITVLIVAGLRSQAYGISFGIEYVNPLWMDHYDYAKLAKMFADIGVRRVKIQEISWQQIEARPPENGIHFYNWEVMDNIVKMFQAEKYEEIEVVIEAASLWASRRITSEEKRNAFKFQKKRPYIDLPPGKREYWKYYHDFIMNFVERYDGDGVDDMPGLKYPILDYEIETEAQGSYHWLGTRDEYIRLLQTAYEAGKKANSRVRIILSGFALSDVVDPDEPVEKRIGMIKYGIKKNWVKYISFFRELLKQKDYFDEIEIHALGHYTQIYTGVRWLRKQMKRLGYEKPIFIGDANSAPAFVAGVIRVYPSPFSLPYRKIITILANKNHARFKEINNWYRAEQSREIVRKTIAAMELGLEKINFAFFADSPFIDKPGARLFATVNPVFYNWQISGILNHNYNPYPAFFTYKLVINKLSDGEFIKRIRLGSGVYGFEFSSRGRPIYVLWSAKKATVDFAVGSSCKAVRVTNIVTKFGQESPQVKIKKVSDGKVKLVLDRNPFFVELLPK